MKKIGKIFLIFCVLFSQFSGVLEVLAEESVDNNTTIDEEDNTLENDDTSQDDNNAIESDVSDDSDTNTNNIVDDNTDDNTNTVVDSEEENNNSSDTVVDDDTTTITDNDTTVADEENQDNNSTVEDDTGSEDNSDEITDDESEDQVVEDTSSYDEDMNDKFVYNGIFKEGILYLIGNEEEYTVSEIKNSFEEDVVINRDSEELLDEVVIDNDDEIIVSMEDNLVKYKVVIMGDDDSSNNVDNNDVESVVNNLFDDPEYYNSIVDINFDGIVDNYDISRLHYAINNKEKSNIVATPVLSPSVVSSKDTLDIGDTVKLQLSVSGLESYSVNTIVGNVDFDSNIFSYSSISSSDGEVYYNDETKSFVAVGEFKEGSTIDLELVADAASETEYVNFTDLKVYNDGTEFELDSDIVSSVFVINYTNNTGSDVEETTDTTSTETTANVSNTSTNYVMTYVNRYILSSDSYLLDLKIKDHEIDFDSHTYEYHVKVGNKINSLDIEVVLSDSNATYVINGNENFEVGENVVTVVVTAEDGSTTTYTIIVDKEAKKETVKEKEESNVSRYIIIGLIVLVIAGLVYLIFKDDSEDEESNN